MEVILENLHLVLEHIVELAVLVFTFIGVITVIYAGLQAVVNCQRKNPKTRLLLGEGLAMGLGFLLVGEVLETVVSHSLKEEVAVVAAIFMLRAAMSVLLHWEGKHAHGEQEHSGE